ncbi:MAG: Maf family nucleotide pyrophosphatase [Pseudomonadota bacterium]|nr:Maf family nucleotide pyrophosphatase [Pseudomonadota bacterium]
MRLILASTSRYRRELLSRLGLPFECMAPDVDESQLHGETPAQLCARLSVEKAQSIAIRHPGALVIGSDQVAELNGIAIGKPGSRERSIQQLRDASNQSMYFHTGISLQHAVTGRSALHIDRTEARFRVLSDAMIQRYLDREAALDCAGGFKCEGLGISLFDAIRSEDPTALIGLPLIALSRILADFGLDPLH